MTELAASLPRPDTVADAIATPETEQPYEALGLKTDEYNSIREILGRRPTSGELAMYSVMWSEHCSYKSSKPYLRQFGKKVNDKMRERLLVGIGENAGVVDIGEGWAVTFKVESHNSPSYIEPFQGAATGVGGIIRDIISMGARPVAVMDQLVRLRWRPLADGLVQSIQDETGRHRGRDTPADDLAGEDVDDESHVDHPLPA